MKKRLKKLTATINLFMIGCYASAQNNKGVEGLEKATEEIVSYYDPLSKLILAVAALVALAGALHVYRKMQRGDDNSKEVAGAYGGAIFFLLVIVGVLKIIFID